MLNQSILSSYYYFNSLCLCIDRFFFRDTNYHGCQLTLHRVPFSVAHLVLVWRDISGGDWTTTVIDAEYQRTVDHLQQ